MYTSGKISRMRFFKNLWLIWCRTVDHRIGKTNEDEPDIPILSLTVPTTHAVLKDYDVRFGSRSSDYPQLGIITIINKIIEKSNKRIKFDYSCDPISMEMTPLKFKLVDVR